MEKDIYIKTEPGGKVSFGKMSDTDVELLKKSKLTGTLSNDLLFKVKRGLSPYRLIEGVINTGDTGDAGNEGLIVLDKEKFEVPRADNNSLETGFYIVHLSLSKVSIEFKLSSRSATNYDSSKLSELSTRVNLPSCVKHPIYSDLNFNIVNGYSYEGKLIKNANKGMIDRGYEEAIFIFSVENDKVNPVYEFLNANELFF
jgi:hypothetical protein